MRYEIHFPSFDPETFTGALSPGPQNDLPGRARVHSVVPSTTDWEPSLTVAGLPGKACAG